MGIFRQAGQKIYSGSLPRGGLRRAGAQPVKPARGDTGIKLFREQGRVLRIPTMSATCYDLKPDGVPI